MANEIYNAGVGRADITPALPARLCGYAVREGLCNTVDEPITATALVIESRGRRVAIVALDLCLASVEFITRVRDACAAALGVPRSAVLVNLSHTHSAPNPPGFVPYDTPEQVKAAERFGQLVIERAAEACRAASASMKQCRMALGAGECAGNINRRQKSPDGSVILGEDPAGTCDRSVRVLRMDDLEGRPVAVAFRYGCHPVTLGPRTNVLSPDFPGVARSLIERELGCTSLFIQGCAGNVNPITGIGQDREGKEDTVRLGQMLGGEVLKICAGLRTHRRRKEPTLVRSVATYWLFENELIPPGAPGTLAEMEGETGAALAPFPPLAEVKVERNGWAEQFAASAGRPESELNVARRFDHWSQVRLEAAQAGPNPATIDFPLQILRIGPLYLLAMPFEVMAETGLKLISDLAPREVWPLGYCNGIVSYLPTPQVSLEGGMEAKLGYKSYLLPSELPGEVEPWVRAGLVALTHHLESQATA